MAKKDQAPSCAPGLGIGSCCKVDAVVTVDDRGQLLLPKDLRERANIAPGDKLAVISWERDGDVCCMSLIKADELTDLVRERLGPMMKDML
jgi:AbrB family looped-hinge helix DNA binding protein